MTVAKRTNPISKLAVVGNYLPRRCGIATFTTDLCEAISPEQKDGDELIAVAMDDTSEGYDYPERVKFRVRADVLSDYYWAAHFLNANLYQATILQHEFGIFGGRDGQYILHMLKHLQMPVLTTLHTVLKEPSLNQKNIIRDLSKYSASLIVMSQKAIELLTEVYGVPRNKITFIPHGIPDVPFRQHTNGSDLTGIPGRQVLLTFGLLGPGKGIENMIRAMPAIMREHPDTLYLVLGQTHPHIREISGDAYRHHLHGLVTQLGLQDHVQFHDQFVEVEALIRYLQSSSIYVIPYLHKEQITSGTLAYAMGTGAAVVSTPFWHAEELLAEGRGRIVPFNDPAALAECICRLLSEESERNTMRLLAYQHGRLMIWREVARQHLQLASDVLGRRRYKPKQPTAPRKRFKPLVELPKLNFAHLKELTDDTGILQHAKYTIPDLTHGYCVDDNARALIAACTYYSLYKDKSIITYAQKYLAFLFYAFNSDNGHFRNFMAYDRHWLELTGSEDSHARALWALGMAVRYGPSEGIRNMAIRLFLSGLPASERFMSPRAWAFTIVGIHAYLSKFSGDSHARKLRGILAEKLFDQFKANAEEQWPWFENIVTYANAKMPHALILAGQWIPNSDMFNAGITALEWLLRIQTAREGHISVIGNQGWLTRDGEKSGFDQQPLELLALIDACSDAYRATGDRKWVYEVERCIGWFTGNNDLNIPVIDHETGGCFDGLEAHGVNANQGAESTLSWIISQLRAQELSLSYVATEQLTEKNSLLQYQQNSGHSLGKT